MQPNSEHLIFEGKRLQLHSFNKMNRDLKMMPYELFYIAAGSFSGPIAFLRDKSMTTDFTLAEEMETNILIFSHKGKLLKKIPYSTSQKVIAFAFTNDEILVIVLASGTYYLTDPFRSTSVKQYRLGQNFSGEELLSCKIIDSKFYFLSAGKRIFEVKNIFQAVPRQIILLSIRSDNPIHHINLDRYGNIDVVYLSDSNEVVCWSTNEKIFTSQYLNDRRSKLVYINRRIEDNLLLLVFHNPLRIAYCKGNQVRYHEPKLKVIEEGMKRSKGRGNYWRETSYHVGWLDDIAVLSNNLWTILVGLTGWQLLGSEPTQARIVGQIDSVRIYSDCNYILRLMPTSYQNMFIGGHNPTIAILYNLFQSYQKGQIIERNTLQALRPQIQQNFDEILQATEFSLEPLEQMAMLKFAIFIKTYYTLSINLKQLCDDFRLVNNLRCQYLNKNWTLHQFRHLKDNERQRLLNILLRYNLHYLGDLIGGGQKVYIHWAKCKVQKEGEEIALKSIIDKFKQYEEKENKQISYIDIARYAMETSRYQLAQNLITYQPNIQKRVTILLWMAVVKRDSGFLEKAIDNAQISYSEDIIFKTVREVAKLQETPEVLRAIERNPIVKRHYLEYLQIKNKQKLKEYYIQNKATTELGLLILKENLGNIDTIPEESMQTINKFLPAVQESLLGRKKNEYAEFLRKIKGKNAVDEAEIDKWKDNEHPEYMAQILLDRGMTEQAIKVLRRVPNENAYMFLQQIGSWKEAAILAKERKDQTKLKSMLEHAPPDRAQFLTKLII